MALAVSGQTEIFTISSVVFLLRRASRGFDYRARGISRIPEEELAAYSSRFPFLLPSRAPRTEEKESVTREGKFRFREKRKKDPENEVLLLLV